MGNLRIWPGLFQFLASLASTLIRFRDKIQAALVAGFLFDKLPRRAESKVESADRARDMIEELFERNKKWSKERIAERPDYFGRLSNLQRPEYLWIGCSDSRVPANVITGLEPGEVFVHRNVANLIHPTDLNMLSVVEFAVLQLRVKHIIICGHYGCGGIHAAVSGESSGLINHWLQPIRDVADSQSVCSGCGQWSDSELDHLCELSVAEQVKRLSRTPLMQNAWKLGQSVAIHGWVYGLKDGLLSNLNCTIEGS